MKLLNKCFASCWCFFCERNIKKNELLMEIYKGAWKGTARINICRECLIKIFLELDVKKKELGEVKSKIIIDNLEDKK